MPYGELGEDPAEVRVPGVAVDDVRVDRLGQPRDVPRERPDDRAERLGDGGEIDRREHATHPEPVAREPFSLLAERPDIDLDELREFADQVLDVDAGSAVDVRRVLVRQH